MKVSYKISLVAVMAMSLALVLILGAGMGSAAAPNPILTDDLVFVGNGAGTVGPIKVVDVDAQAMVNAIGGGGNINSNHGIQMSGDGRYIYTANAALANYRMRAVKYDLGTLSEAAVYTDTAVRPVTAATGLCGIEFNLNDASGNLWVTQMTGASGNGGGGIYEINPATGFTGAYLDTGTGTDARATCGIGWNASGSTAYTSLMNAKKTYNMSWPGGTVGSSVTHTATLHILDTNKSLGLVYVAGGNGSGTGSTIDVIDMATMTVVGQGPALTMNPHSATLAHGNGFLYSHSRPTASNGSLGYLLVYDLGGGGTAGASPTTPVLIASIPDGANGGGSCGNDVVTKSNYCTAPALSITKTSTYWGSYADYTAGILSVNYSIGNGSALAGANTVAIAGSINTNGVTMASASSVANIAGGGSAPVTIKYNVPSGVGSFKATVYATAKDLCNNSYAYPGPYPTA